ncbi:peptide transporter family 1-like [Ctenocephalides felis]|uniref:peptide transporter family 1-like n=1 Tax=Ctenocephalides felis TaxID=7515 RepID=UPI000E6E53CC|nr:peptide transporter family 1-like [Ctenocephalides felis]
MTKSHCLMLDLENDVFKPSLLCIVACEFFERFAFSGLRTILSLYLRNVLLMPEQLATITYHLFMLVSYAFPIIGALIADGLLGRYRTIFYFILIYLAGTILMCFAATPPIGLQPIISTSFGLLLIAVGTGGMKPCVAAFGGDQYQLPKEEDLVAVFFALFYFTINLGGLAGMIVIPIFKRKFSCFNQDTCYTLGFGTTASLMMMSFGVFVMGKFWYRRKTPRTKEILHFFKLIIFALRNRNIQEENPTTIRRHFLDRGRSEFNQSLIDDGKVLLKVLYLYLPLPIFWALFDQQGSRWTFQASRMNGNIFGVQIQPDQTQVANPFLALLLIPILEQIYHLFIKSGFNPNPLKRMLLGGLVAGLAFVASGLLEMRLQSTYPQVPLPGEARLYVVNTLPCPCEIIGLEDTIRLDAGARREFNNLPANPWEVYEVLAFAPMLCDEIELDQPGTHLKVNLTERQVRTLLVGVTEDNGLALKLTQPLEIDKALSGKSKLRIEVLVTSSKLVNMTLDIVDTNGGKISFSSSHISPGLKVSGYTELRSGFYHYRLTTNHLSSGVMVQYASQEFDMRLEMGAVYSLILRETDKGEIDFNMLQAATPASNVHILWILPQYFLLSLAEVLFAISGLEFSFTQAPKSMKTITLGAWYLCVAAGNLLTICITKMNMFSSQAHEFFLFAGLQFLDMLLFWFMSRNYVVLGVQADGSSCAMMSTRFMPIQD